MKVKYLKTAAGVSEGTVRELRDDIAKAMISKGFCEECKSAPKKEDKPELITKEEKSNKKRTTKGKK